MLNACKSVTHYQLYKFQRPYAAVKASQARCHCLAIASHCIAQSMRGVPCSVKIVALQTTSVDFTAMVTSRRGVEETLRACCKIIDKRPLPG